MKQLQKWTVCLGMHEKDEAVLDRVAEMARFFKPESLHVLHVIEGSDLPGLLKKDYPDLHEPRKEYFYNRIHDLCRDHLPGVEKVDIEVLEGNKLRTILSSLVERDSDLVVLGRGEHGGTIMKKIVRKSGASVLIIPEGDQEPLQHTLVATDFSTHSLRALQIASSLSIALEIPKTSVLHVCNDSSKYAGEAVETAFDVQEVLKKRLVIEEKLHTYSKYRLATHVREAQPQVRVEEQVVPTSPGKKKSEALVNWVKESDADLVILGAKGQSVAQAFFLGSFAEDVYTQLSRQVILLFKQKGENAGFLKLLLGKEN